jgi:hypothetical protein
MSAGEISWTSFEPNLRNCDRPKNKVMIARPAVPPLLDWQQQAVTFSRRYGPLDTAQSLNRDYSHIHPQPDPIEVLLADGLVADSRFIAIPPTKKPSVDFELVLDG